MKAIADIEVGQLHQALAWALEFVKKEYGDTPQKILTKPQAVIAFASACILYNDEIDLAAGDSRLDTRLKGEFDAVFADWASRQ